MLLTNEAAGAYGLRTGDAQARAGRNHLTTHVGMTGV